MIALAAIVRGDVGAQSGDAPPSLPRNALRRLDVIARELAKKGLEREATTTIDILRDAGYDPKSIDRLVATCARAAERARSRPADRGDVRRVEGVLKVLAAALPRDAAANATIARTMLRLDATSRPAHEALGHVEHRGTWITPERKTILARRDAIQDAVHRARRLDVPLVTRTSRAALLRAIGRDDGTTVRADKFVAHGTISTDRLTRLVRAALRAHALSSWLRTGQLILPEHGTTNQLVVVETNKAYLDAIDKLVAAGWMTADYAGSVREHASCIVRGYRLTYLSTHAHRAAFLLYMLSGAWEEHAYGGTVQPCLVAGHLNWICLSFLGGPFARLLTDPTVSETPRRYAGEEAAEREAAKRMAGAGIAGSRSWMRYLASREEDPSWSRSIVPQIGDVQGDDLLKSTFVVEFLQERGTLVDLMRASSLKTKDPVVVRKRLVDALGEPLATFEARWRRWLLAEESIGLMQRLGGGATPAPLPADATRALTAVNAIRKRAWNEEQFGPFVPTTLDRTLSVGALAHARYLHRHPDQAAKWPDAHEQYPDREGFSPAGSWAGLHSVIAPGSASPDDAIADWMGTFYHRLPLVVPGLIKIGWGYDHRIAVLDSGSITNPDLYVGHVAWPTPNATGVPTAFVPELPNPVPGEDQSAWGYPITIQFLGDARHVTMTLSRGKKPGDPVECHYLTPYAPKNVELAPSNAFCLIPKATLASNAWYHVVVTPDGVDGGEAIAWSFKTR